MSLGFEIFGDGPIDWIDWFCDAGWGKIGWLSKVNGFLKRFLKMNHYYTQLFYG